MALLERHGVTPRKALGQHFVIDPSVIAKLVAIAGVGPGDLVVEIGAGTGTLTRALAATGAIVRAYEVDERLAPVLAEVLAPYPVTEVVIADVARRDLAAELSGGPWALVANLPYHVGTPLVLDLLRRAPQVATYAVMVQREVADRLAAAPGSKLYGLPSVVAALYGRGAETVTRLPPDVFYPRPRVDSALVVLERRAEVPAAAGVAAGLAAVAFGQRRKMVRNSLAGRVPVGDLERAGIDPAARAEQLGAEDYLRLAEVGGDG